MTKTTIAKMEKAMVLALMTDWCSSDDKNATDQNDNWGYQGIMNLKEMIS